MGDLSEGLSTLEYHVLVALASEALYGYAITAAVEEESSGTVRPRAGTLYRVLARLMACGLVSEDTGPRDDAHPGRARRWYALTPEGHTRLVEESRRLIDVATLAQSRLKARPS